MDLAQKHNYKKCMRVAWIAPNGGNFTLDSLKGTGGWISSMESALMESREDIELALIFTHPGKTAPIKRGRVTYYPVCRPLENNIQKLWNRWFRNEEQYEEQLVAKMVERVKEFEPDVVHVWGCENFYAKVLKYISYPSVVHIQGLASSIIQHYLPDGMSVEELALQDNFIDRYLLKRGNLYDYKSFLSRVHSEKEIATYITNFVGRTEWDKTNSHKLSPQARYFHCDELMRKEFFEQEWHYHHDGKLVIHSSISNTWYKGMDLVLRAAQTLKSSGVDFVWNVYGVTASSSVVQYFSRKYDVVLEDVNIKFFGYVDADTLVRGLLECDLYVHPSHIENSSNAIAEAMMLGVPVVAQSVGGNPTMLDDDSGVLVQSNDMSSLIYHIRQMSNREVAEKYSSKARTLAQKRHNKAKVVAELTEVYNAVVNGAH